MVGRVNARALMDAHFSHGSRLESHDHSPISSGRRKSSSHTIGETHLDRSPIVIDLS